MDLVTEPVSGVGFSVRTADDIATAEVSGELDISSSPALREQLISVLRAGSSRLVIDLSRVTYCDVSGLVVLVGTGRRARLLGGSLRLAAISPQVEQVLHATGLHGHFEVFATVHAATADAQGPPGETIETSARTPAA